MLFGADIELYFLRCVTNWIEWKNERHKRQNKLLFYIFLFDKPTLLLMQMVPKKRIKGTI